MTRVPGCIAPSDYSGQESNHLFRKHVFQTRRNSTKRRTLYARRHEPDELLNKADLLFRNILWSWLNHLTMPNFIILSTDARIAVSMLNIGFHPNNFLAFLVLTLRCISSNGCNPHIGNREIIYRVTKCGLASMHTLPRTVHLSKVGYCQSVAFGSFADHNQDRALIAGSPLQPLSAKTAVCASFSTHLSRLHSLSTACGSQNQVLHRLSQTLEGCHILKKGLTQCQLFLGRDIPRTHSTHSLLLHFTTSWLEHPTSSLTLPASCLAKTAPFHEMTR